MIRDDAFNFLYRLRFINAEGLTTVLTYSNKHDTFRIVFINSDGTFDDTRLRRSKSAMEELYLLYDYCLKYDLPLQYDIAQQFPEVII